VFDPFDMTTIEVRYHGTPHGLALPHRIARHSHPKARPELPENPPPKPTGINYLEIVANTHQNDIGGQINYDALGRGDDATASGPEEIPLASDPDLALEKELAEFAALSLPGPGRPPETTDPPEDQIPGQLDLTNLLPDADHTDTGQERS
jgi:hypothetical protein